MRRYLQVVLLTLAAVAAAQNLIYHPDSGWRPPADAVSRLNPLAEKKELAAGGRKLFLRHCAECHGDDGRGLKDAADLRLTVVQRQTDGALHWKISNGNPRHGMPSFSAIPELQRWQIVLHLRTLAGEGPDKR